MIIQIITITLYLLVLTIAAYLEGMSYGRKQVEEECYDTFKRLQQERSIKDKEIEFLKKKIQLIRHQGTQSEGRSIVADVKTLTKLAKGAGEVIRDYEERHKK